MLSVLPSHASCLKPRARLISFRLRRSRRLRQNLSLLLGFQLCDFSFTSEDILVQGYELSISIKSVFACYQTFIDPIIDPQI